MKASELTIEEILSRVSCWEDPDQMLIVSPNEDGTVTISDYEWYITVKGETFREALINYGKKQHEGSWGVIR